MRPIYRMRADEVMTPTLLENYIEYVKPELARREKLFNYYTGKHAISNRVYADATKPNNKVVSPYPHYITDFSTGYFVGEPIRYEAPEGVDLEPVLKYNDDSAVNTALAKNCSICGYAYELAFIDKYGEYRYISLDPTKTFAIYDDSLEQEILYAIRLYDEYDVANKRWIHYAEVYSKESKATYRKVSTLYELIDEQPNFLSEVPVVEYINNEEGLGDFELCVSLIDAYDSVMSDAVNESAEFADAYLVLTGMMGTDDDDITAMKANRVLLMDTDASAQWLTKTADSTNAENMKNRIDTEIHKFSGVPDMTDQSFASNASGVAMKYKLLGLEDITAKKETEFRRGLARRIELYSEYAEFLFAGFDFRDVRFIFTRNLPSNLDETADLLSKIGHLLSTETQLKMLPLDIDVPEELDRIKAEKLAGYDDGFYNPSESAFKDDSTAFSDSDEEEPV